jgi:hypothetical protein
MVKQVKQKATRRRATQKPKVLESITGSDGLLILKTLAERDQKMAKQIEAVARELLDHVEMEDVAADVQMELECLDVEDVWDKSGATRYGYVDPGDAAWQMFEDILKPFEEAVEKYKRISMPRQAKMCWQGILKGIYDFEKESSTEYKQWATDAPGEYFGQVLDGWKKLFKGRPPLVEMEDFLGTHCPDWTEWAIRHLGGRKRIVKGKPVKKRS